MNLILPNRRKIALVPSTSRFSLEEFTEQYIQRRLRDGEENKPMVFNDIEKYRQFLNRMKSRENAYGFESHNSCVDSAIVCTHFCVQTGPYSLQHYSVALYAWKRVWA